MIAEADMRIMLMVLIHMTGDFRWLESPFRPKRDVRLIPDPQAGLPEDAQAEIRQAALSLFLSPTRKPVITDPGDALMRKMMSACLGEEVPSEYAPLIREEMGLVSRDMKWNKPPTSAELANRHVLIVGAGVSGIGLAMALQRLGIPYTVIDRNDQVGGTWYVNRYPGCGVDTPNHSYSYSFNSHYRWSRYFSPRKEVQNYLETTVAEFGITANLRLSTRLISAIWDEQSKQWISTLETPTGTQQFTSAFLVSAIGQFSEPFIPNIAGLDRFSGHLFHTMHWPDNLDISGKRVAVIGTGATAMQLVPEIADRVLSATIYQRTPQWARPISRYSDPIDRSTQWLLKNMPFYAEWFRFNMFWRYGDGLLPLLRKDPSWKFPERAVNRVNDRHRQELTDFIRSELGDRNDLIEKCIPSYPPYGKRILLDNGWYRTLLKPNVELVDIPLERIDHDGIITADGARRQTDVIVLSTGFNVAEMAGRLDIVGRQSLGLAEAWADENPRAYLGLLVPGFPNFFCMLGPNSGPAHGGSVIFQVECQSRYITGCIVEMIERGSTAIEIRKDAHDDYVRKVDAEHNNLIWTHPGTSTYYRNRHGRVFSVMPWRFVDYWRMTHKPNLADYQASTA